MRSTALRARGVANLLLDAGSDLAALTRSITDGRPADTPAAVGALASVYERLDVCREQLHDLPDSVQLAWRQHYAADRLTRGPDFGHGRSRHRGPAGPSL